jgi:hypothetical protein
VDTRNDSGGASAAARDFASSRAPVERSSISDFSRSSYFSCFTDFRPRRCTSSRSQQHSQASFIQSQAFRRAAAALLLAGLAVFQLIRTVPSSVEFDRSPYTRISPSHPPLVCCAVLSTACCRLQLAVPRRPTAAAAAGQHAKGRSRASEQRRLILILSRAPHCSCSSAVAIDRSPAHDQARALRLTAGPFPSLPYPSRPGTWRCRPRPIASAIRRTRSPAQAAAR